MKLSLRAMFAGAVAEFIHLRRSPLLLSLTVVQAITFLVLVSLFGMTGAKAPTAVINNDHGMLSELFVDNLKNAHHSFTVRPMAEAPAMKAIQHGDLVAAIIIPNGFSKAMVFHYPISLKVIVDNIDTDMTDDIQRALPSAIVSFARKLQLSGIHARTFESDLVDHDTDFVPYLAVSSLVLAAFFISAMLSASTVAREYESGTFSILASSPVHPLFPLLGRVLASNVIALTAILLALSLVILGYGVHPEFPLELAVALLVCILVFGFMGIAIGAAVKRTLPVASLVFGIALPMYLVSGSYEPERLDGNLIWTIAHFTPIYYGVGVFEHAALGLFVTPESVALNFLGLLTWALLALMAAYSLINREPRKC